MTYPRRFCSPCVAVVYRTTARGPDGFKERGDDVSCWRACCLRAPPAARSADRSRRRRRRRRRRQQQPPTQPPPPATQPPAQPPEEPRQVRGDGGRQRARKTEQKLINAPATMSVITGDDDRERADRRTSPSCCAAFPGQRHAGLGTGHQRHQPRRDRHAGDRAAGAARRPQPLPGLLRLRDVGLPAGEPERGEADRGHPRAGVGGLGRQRVLRRRQRDHQVAARDAGHQRGRRVRRLRPRQRR